MAGIVNIAIFQPVFPGMCAEGEWKFEKVQSIFNGLVSLDIRMDLTKNYNLN